MCNEENYFSRGSINGCPDVLVIIPTCEYFGYAEQAIESMHRTTVASGIKVQCLLIDDASEQWPISAYGKCNHNVQKIIRFAKRGGLTRSWNCGIKQARECGAKFTVCANSDILFSKGWAEPLIAALNDGYELVGPVTNAPGHIIWQSVSPFIRPEHHAMLDDNEGHIDAIGQFLRKKDIGSIESPINGFFMMGKTNSWISGGFDDNNVFNPAIPLKGNEVELQSRWRRLRYRTAIIPTSYIFHYRSVSRPEGLSPELGRGAQRSLHIQRLSAGDVGE
jgi:GT2 family glycosyltransferase